MANKKTKVDKLSLPLVNSGNKYLVRYRLVLDKNKNSDWSQIFSIPAKPVIEVSGVTKFNAGTVNVVWENTNQLNSHDVFIKYSDTDQFIYHGTTVSTNYVVIPQVSATAGTKNIYVLVQSASNQRKVSAPLKVYSGTDTWTVL